MLRAACSRIVDLPMPGSPPKRVMEPATRPPPRTLSSSLKPVEDLASVESSTADRGTGFWRIAVPAAFFPEKAPPAVFAGTGASTIVFHSLQAGHWPTHLEDSCPQLLQKNTVLIFFANLFTMLKRFTTTRTQSAVCRAFSSPARPSYAAVPVESSLIRLPPRAEIPCLQPAPQVSWIQ